MVLRLTLGRAGRHQDNLKIYIVVVPHRHRLVKFPQILGSVTFCVQKERGVSLRHPQGRLFREKKDLEG